MGPHEWSVSDYTAVLQWGTIAECTKISIFVENVQACHIPCDVLRQPLDHKPLSQQSFSLGERESMRHLITLRSRRWRLTSWSLQNIFTNKVRECVIPPPKPCVLPVNKSICKPYSFQQLTLTSSLRCFEGSSFLGPKIDFTLFKAGFTQCQFSGLFRYLVTLR